VTKDPPADATPPSELPGAADRQSSSEEEAHYRLWQAVDDLDLDASDSEEVPDQELFIPVHGFVRLTSPEVAVVDHPAFQRLGDVFQLGQTHLVYRGATHRRFEHCLGTVHVADLLMESIRRNAVAGGGTNGGEWKHDLPLNADERAFTRLGALLHDIGHLPAGHTFEDELGIFDKHDEPERLRLILDRRSLHGVDSEPLRAVIDSGWADHAASSGLKKTASEILIELVAKQGGDSEADATVGDKSFRRDVCRDLIGNTICADLLDYLHRDWHHLGKHRYFDVRLVDYMEIRRNEAEHRSELVINLRSAERVRTDGVSAILELLESRYQLHEIALFHRTKLSASAMLERVVSEIRSSVPEDDVDEWQRNLIERLLDTSDAEMLTLLMDEARGRVAHAPDALRAVQDTLRDLRLRRLNKPVFERFGHQIPENRIMVENLYAPGHGGGREAARNRLDALRKLEADFALPPVSLAMYCPPAQMNTKIADVKILVDGRVSSLDAYESAFAADSGLTGGHLEAQKKRFQRLWRVYLACRPDALTQLEESGHLALLRRAIGSLVLGIRDLGGESYEEMAFSVAKDLRDRGGAALQEGELVAFSAARSDPPQIYPTGAPTLLSRIDPAG